MPQSRSDLVPIGQAAVRARISRERLRHRVEIGEIAGEFVDGRLFVQAAEVERLERERTVAVSRAESAA